MAGEWIRLGASRLSIGITSRHEAVVATLVGSADETALATIVEGGVRLLEEDATVVVWDVRGLEAVVGAGAAALARVGREAQRLEKELRLVGCGEALAGELRAAGLRGDYWHYPGLVAATDGLVEEPGHAVTVYLRRSRATRARLRLVVASLARPCGLDEDDQAALVVALDDACALAAQTSSGEDEPLTIACCARDGVLTADVGWRVSPTLSRDADEIWARRPSARARIAAALDGVETLAQTDGLVIRLVRRTRGVPVVLSAPEATPLRLPDEATRRRARAATGQRPRRRRGFTWGRWPWRPSFAFVAGWTGRWPLPGKARSGEKKHGQSR